jgi:hypothetical protein
VLAADERRAQRIGVPMHIVVLDACGVQKASLPATKRWSLVHDQGNIFGSSGVTTAASVRQGAGDGTCLVPFDRDISHRARVATNGGAHPRTGQTAGFIKPKLPDSTSVRRDDERDRRHAVQPRLQPRGALLTPFDPPWPDVPPPEPGAGRSGARPQ